MPTFCRRTGPRQWTCYRPHGAVFASVLTLAALRPGSSGLLRLRLDSEGLEIPRRPDPNPADNTRYVRLTALGAADLRVRIEPAAGNLLPAGSPRPVAVRIYNAGPDEATGVTATVTVTTRDQSRLTVIGVDRRRWQPNQTTQRLPVGRLGAGRTATFTLTLIGASPGTAVSVAASAQSSDANGASGQVRLSVVAAASRSPAATPQLPATGPPVEVPLLVGLGLLASGLLLLTLARRRPRSAR